MFTVEQRDALHERVLRLAEEDDRVVAGAAVGSLAVDAGDRFSDLDLTFGIADHVPVDEVLDDWRMPLRSASLSFADGVLRAASPAGRAVSPAPCDRPSYMTERDPTLEPFDALIGTWATEATHPMLDAVVPGSITFEWLEGGHFLVQRSHNDHELFPDAICVIGAPEAGEGLVMEYFDSRGVRRTYRVSLDDGVLRIWRDDPEFAQRFSATPAHGSFDGQWQLARTPGDWQDDLKVTYRRRG